MPLRLLGHSVAGAGMWQAAGLGTVCDSGMSHLLDERTWVRAPERMFRPIRTTALKTEYGPSASSGH